MFAPRDRHAVVFKPFPKQCMTDRELEEQKECRTWQAWALSLGGLFQRARRIRNSEFLQIWLLLTDIVSALCWAFILGVFAQMHSVLLASWAY